MSELRLFHVSCADQKVDAVVNAAVQVLLCAYGAGEMTEAEEVFTNYE